MSEYQWVEFLAVDAPLDDAAVRFMQEQSTRALIDEWRFTNEYHFGDFHGDVLQMMRRGYDVHVHYTNFGVRRIWLRIPDGFGRLDHLERYLLEDEIYWIPDDDGTGGVLALDPEGDADSWDWLEDVGNLASDFIPLRDMIIRGDFRPLYLAHLAFNYDPDGLEPPVPAGLGDENRALARLCEFYEIAHDLVSVAAEASPTGNPEQTDDAFIDSWLERQTRTELISNLKSCLRDHHRHPTELLRTILTEATISSVSQPGSRQIAELRRRVDEMDAERELRRKAAAAEDAERRRAEAKRALQAKLARIAENPERSFARIDAAINERNRPAYQRAAQELSLIAKACGEPMAIAKAESIRSQYPTRSALSSELKKAGF